MPVSAEKQLLERFADAIAPTATAHKSFRDRYWDDPVGFVRDCIHWRPGEGLADYQEECLQALATHRRVCVRGPHGLGKTTTNALAVLWFALTRDGDDWKVATTAGAWRQLTQYLWPEIRKWSHKIKWDKLGRKALSEKSGGELHHLHLKMSTGEAFAVASSDPSLIEGAHADHILYIFDESKAIKSSIFNAAEGALSTGNAYALATSTPGEPAGRFFEIQSRKPGYEDWWARHVKQWEVIRAGRMEQSWADARKKQWGETSTIYQNRVLGEFASTDEDTIIPLAWVDAAVERYNDWFDLEKTEREAKLDPFTCISADVARYGSDRTALAERFGEVIKDIRTYSKQDTMETTGVIAGILQARGGYAIVDVIGVGAGVVDRLREQEYECHAFNAAEGTDKTDVSGEIHFGNKRAAAWWGMRDLLNPDNGHLVCLPPRDFMIGDLVTPKWKTSSNGRVFVEAKDDIRKRLGITLDSGQRSTDEGDAVVMAFFNENLAAAGTSSETHDAARRKYDEMTGEVMNRERGPYSKDGWTFGSRMGYNSSRMRR